MGLVIIQTQGAYFIALERFQRGDQSLKIDRDFLFYFFFNGVKPDLNGVTQPAADNFVHHFRFSTLSPKVNKSFTSRLSRRGPALPAAIWASRSPVICSNSFRARAMAPF